MKQRNTMNFERAPDIPVVVGNVYTILNAVAKKGDVEVMELLLKNETIDPSLNGNEALLLAILSGHTEVAKLLLSDSRVFRYADENNQLEIMKKFMANFVTSISKAMVKQQSVDATK